jgi:poly(hydroxyalkanoate) granule-associated protein
MTTRATQPTRSEKTGTAVDELVERGRDVERTARRTAETTITELRELAETRLNALTELVEHSVQRVLSRLEVPTNDELETLRGRIHELDATVNDLIRELDVSAADGDLVLHVVPDSAGWLVEVEGGGPVESTHRTKKDALDRARERGRAGSPSRVVVHRADGTIQRQIRYDDGAS